MIGDTTKFRPQLKVRVAINSPRGGRGVKGSMKWFSKQNLENASLVLGMTRNMIKCTSVSQIMIVIFKWKICMANSTELLLVPDLINLLQDFGYRSSWHRDIDNFPKVW